MLGAREREERPVVDQHQAGVCELGAALERQGDVLGLVDAVRQSEWYQFVCHLDLGTGAPWPRSVPAGSSWTALALDLVRDPVLGLSRLDGSYRHPERLSRRFAGQVAGRAGRWGRSDCR